MDYSEKTNTPHVLTKSSYDTWKQSNTKKYNDEMKARQKLSQNTKEKPSLSSEEISPMQVAFPEIPTWNDKNDINLDLHFELAKILMDLRQLLAARDIVIHDIQSTDGLNAALYLELFADITAKSGNKNKALEDYKKSRDLVGSKSDYEKPKNGKIKAIESIATERIKSKILFLYTILHMLSFIRQSP